MDPDRLLVAATELAVRLDRLRPGVLDGPAPDTALVRRVARERTADPRALAADASRLRARADAEGARYLGATLDALHTGARLLAGDRPGFLEQVHTTFGVHPRRGDPEVYREAHRALGELLPGRETLAHRVRAYREADVVPAARLGGAVAAVTDVLRGLTRDRLGLPRGERATVTVVGGRPWAAFTRHHGNLHSRVSVCGTGRVRAGALLPLLAHEVYPGHHTQYCRAAAASAEHPELGLRLVHGPQAVVMEGAAEAAASVVPGPGWGAVAQRALAGAGVRIDGPLAERVEAALGLLGGVRQDAALMRHVDGAGPDEVVAFLSRWLLVPEPRARRVLAFLDHPRWRGYPVTYAEGGPLVTSWLARCPESRVTGLRRLLDTPVLPADLVGDGAGAPCGAGAGPVTDHVPVLRPPG